MKKDWNTLKKLRIERINKIKSIILRVSKAGQNASYKKIIAEFCLMEGLSKRTVKEYIDLLIDSGQIIREEDDLLPRPIKEEIDGELKVLDNQKI